VFVQTWTKHPYFVCIAQSAAQSVILELLLRTNLSKASIHR
jgi:hypothetical protein